MDSPNLARSLAVGNAKRVLVYSHDTFGLGNIRRMLEISRHLVESDPDMSVLIITGSPMLHAFRIPPRIDYVKLPCLSRNVEGAYAPKFLDISVDQGAKLRANLIRSAVLDFSPDLILVDKKPFGVCDELASTFAALPSLPKRPRLVLLLRDILDSPEETTRVWRKNHYHEAIAAYYDEVLVVGTPDVFDLAREYAFPPLAAAKVNYCGYIARRRSTRSRDEMRRQLGIGDKQKLILVTPGGGEDGYALLRDYLAGLDLGERRGAHSLVLCGPEMDEQQRRHLVEAAQGRDDLSVQSFSDDMMSLIDAADLVVCMGGYNTVCEVLTLKKRAIVVPRVKPVQEQWIRAERLARRGLLRAIHPAQLTPALLAATVTEELAALAKPRRQVPGLAMDGLAQVAAAIDAQLRPERVRREHVRPVEQPAFASSSWSLPSWSPQFAQSASW